MEFLVVDFETACAENCSICQVGLVKYKDGEYSTLIDSLINPKTVFTNTHIHGISANDVNNAPLFQDIYPELEKYMKGQIVFNHNGADKSKFEESCKKYDLPIFEVTWLNSATLVRRTWKQFSKSGYGIENICAFLNISHVPHNAASDARVTTEIILRASETIGYSEKDWLYELKQSSDSSRSSSNFIHYDETQRIKGELTDAPDLENVKNKENPFFGKKVVISGTYETWPDRKELAKLLKELGADIDSGVGKYTNYLCAGDGVGWKKIEKMEKKIEKGEDAKILKESEILQILSSL